jgi:hypothetical protein
MSHCAQTFCLFVFETGSCYVAQLALNSWLKPFSLSSWDYRPEPLDLTY